MIRRSLGRASVEELAGALAGRPGLSILDGDGSAGGGEFSYLACDPAAVFEADSRAPLSILGALDGAREGAPSVPRDIGYVAYDAAFPGRPGPLGLPLARFARFEAVLRVHEASGEVELFATSEAAAAKLEGACSAAPSSLERFTASALEEDDEDAHHQAIERALAWIAAGDVYQVNLARRWRAACSGDPLSLYLAMRRASPVPLGFFQRVGEAAILSRSMETFLAFDAGARRLESRPIKGTLARRGDDEGTARELRADPKEHAEHSMIVDLMRNDLGRVAEIGSVAVEAPFCVEPYARLSHLVSTVSARVRAGLDLRDVFEATFPPGSVTGTPKLRAVQRIDELEAHPRGVYCGALGHVAHDGSHRFSVAIRTALVARGALHYHAGGGIVAASDARRELEETRLKARALLDALEALEGR